MVNCDKAIELFDECIAIVSLKRSDKDWLKHADADLVQLLETILQELRNMKEAMNPEDFMPSYPRLVVEYWDEFPDIGDYVLKAFQDYKRLEREVEGSG